jgi:hypothetical protein
MKKVKRSKDMNEVAKSIVDIATSEKTNYISIVAEYKPEQSAETPKKAVKKKKKRVIKTKIKGKKVSKKINK